MRYVVRPISDRTAFTGDHRNSPFTASWSSALELLDRELDELDAENIVFEVDVQEKHIRLDGMLRSDARTATPAVRLAFDSRQGPLVYATDAFQRTSWNRSTMDQHWQHNLYAIALALEALRKVDRYGVTGRGEQYAGFKQIGAGTGAAPSGAVARMTDVEAERVIRGAAGSESQMGVRIDEVFRRARALAHPDRHDGDRAPWDQVEEAGKVLGLVR